eukprot:4373309-Pyramimonas_sp.AAC.1
MELSDDDPLRGNPRDAGDLPGRIQCNLGHDKGLQNTFAVSDRSLGRQGRSASRQAWRRKYRADDDDEEWEDDARLARRGPCPQRLTRTRARALQRRSL